VPDEFELLSGVLGPLRSIIITRSVIGDVDPVGSDCCLLTTLSKSSIVSLLISVSGEAYIVRVVTVSLLLLVSVFDFNVDLCA
jgi:hypothetical protein